MPGIERLSSVPASSMSFDLSRARGETPGCQTVLHFNNAGAGLMPQPVRDAVIKHLKLEAEIGAYEAEARSHDAVEHVYDAIAALIGCSRDEVAVVENATRAWDMAFYSLPLGPGDRILTAEAEYASNYIAYLQVARRTGARVEVVPDDEHGQISIDALRNAIDDKVKLISITHVPTNGGLVNPAAEVGKVARESGVLFLLDACQSVGQLPINIDEIGCDMLSATGRKYLRGPRGTGFLFVRKSLISRLEPVLLDLHAADWVSRDEYVIRPDARRFENWEGNIAGKIGLGVAIDYAMEWGLKNIWTRISDLASTLRAGLRAIPGLTVRDRGAQQCGIVSFTAEGREPEEIRRELSAEKINVWTSPLHFTRLDMSRRGLGSVVRASVHYYNSEQEVERFCEVLARLLG